MNTARLPLLFILVLSFGALAAQDIHFSLFNFSPLTLNPAHTGAFYGTARVGGIYRDQWNTIPGARGFRTPSFYVDAPIIPGLGKRDWIGVGVSMLSDRAGTSNLRTNATLFSGAYHKSLDKDGKTVLTLGIQGGTTQRRVDIQSIDLIFEDEAPIEFGGGGLGIGAGGDRETRDRSSYFDLNAGLMLRSTLNDQSSFELGFAMAHIIQPEYTLIPFGEREDRRRPMRAAAHAAFHYDITDRWRVTPMAMFQSTQGITEIIPQLWAGVLVNPEKKIRLNFGTGYRLNDAVPLLVGLDYDDLRVALAYDVNTSPLNQATNSVGGFELAVQYIFKIYKKPNVTPAILCPEF
jgi:type IX secretion system PorP/SprF family membrane protein